MEPQSRIMMDEQQLKELDEKIARWAEWKQSNGYWYPPPHTNPVGLHYSRPPFTEDESACFKWLEKPLVDHFIRTTPSEEAYRVAYHYFLCEWMADYVWNEPHKPALALCRGVEKLIDVEAHGISLRDEDR